ncbi:50S ribosomal protein L5 [Microgenomates group bacterium RBG_16_45_19]|nr:ribosomal protein L5 [uncultured bacterium]OGV95979.1 MAG: 50S ribosomal protein L5 [Microgenomates group bacterium RBG_16_45_19]
MEPLAVEYQQRLVKELQQTLKRSNPLSLPRLSKIVVNVGVGKSDHRDQVVKNVADQLLVITGQKPKVTRAKQSISGFNLRQGDPVGVAVTLRGRCMYQFFEKLVRIVLPRVKDFQGVSPEAFDQSGTYTLGLSEQIVFPEIEYDKIDTVRGLEITIVTTARNPAEAKLLLTLFGIPFRREEATSG